MGFVTGFTGGVTLTLGLAYLTTEAHRRNRDQQSAAIRAMTLSTSQLVDPIPTPLPPTRSEVAAAQRASSIEAVKDRWNHEVLNAVRWVQHTDWKEVREGMEDTASDLWHTISGQSPQGTAEEAKQRLETATQAAKAKATGAQQRARASASDAAQRLEQDAQDIEMSAQDKALEARLKGREAATKLETKVEDTATGAKNALSAAVEKGKSTASALVNKAKDVVGLAEDKLESASVVDKLPAVTPVQRALQQRYQRPEAKNNRTVAQALNERYLPLDERDNTVLRGV